MNKNILLPFVCLFFLVIDLYFFSYNQLGVYCGLILIVLFVYLSGYSISSPISLLLFGVVFFNARPFLDIIFETTTFGNTNGFFKKGTFDIAVLTNSYIYIKCSVLAFMFGMLKISTERKKNSKDILSVQASNKYFDIYILFICIPTITAVTYLIVLCHFNGGYAYFNSGETIVIILRLFIPLITVCLSLNLVFFKRNYLTISFIILGVAVSGLIGARLLGLMPILCFMVYSSFYHRKVYSKMFPLVAVTIILFTVIVNYYRAGNSIVNDTDYIFYLRFFLNEISFTSNLTPMSFEFTAVHVYAFGINYLGA
ncbi:hypothetical protein ACRTC3_19900 [Photobacterium damselae]|uniref:hypothetical protein n=1 Tax=Photobacterium damselae TaxID=38293 RepID=UPI003D7E9402